jgi:hypothetical protein
MSLKYALFITGKAPIIKHDKNLSHLQVHKQHRKFLTTGKWHIKTRNKLWVRSSKFRNPPIPPNSIQTSVTDKKTHVAVA